MSRGTPTTTFRIDPALKARAHARANREGTDLTAIVIAALEAYAADEPTPDDPRSEDMTLDKIQRRAADLQREIDDATDDAAARQAADELHALMDDVDNVAVLDRQSRSGQPRRWNRRR